METHDTKPMGYIQDLEAERDKLRSAIETAVARFGALRWGYDGDCGSTEIMSELEDSLK
jgi:hypothetical protein